MLISFFNPSDLIGCGGDINQSDSFRYAGGMRGGGMRRGYAGGTRGGGGGGVHGGGTQRGYTEGVHAEGVRGGGTQRGYAQYAEGAYVEVA